MKISKEKGMIVGALATLAILLLGIIPGSVAPASAAEDPKIGHASFDALPQVLRVIALCESALDPTAQNPHSTASGLFQFTNPTWSDFRVGNAATAGQASIDEQVQAALKLYEARGAQPWDVNGRASKHCWGPKVDYIPAAHEIRNFSAEQLQVFNENPAPDIVPQPQYTPPPVPQYAPPPPQPQYAPPPQYQYAPPQQYAPPPPQYYYPPRRPVKQAPIAKGAAVVDGFLDNLRPLIVGDDGLSEYERQCKTQAGRDPKYWTRDCGYGLPEHQR